MNLKKIGIIILSCILCYSYTFAHDFAVTLDGQKIYFNIKSQKNKTVEVTYNGTPWTEGNEYEYNTTTGEFETKAGAITVPSATTTRDDTTGAVSITPGVSTITVTGTI